MKVSSHLPANELTADLCLTFSACIQKLKEESIKRNLSVSDKSWVRLGSLLIEAVADLTLSLDLEPEIFFSLSFEMSSLNTGRALMLTDGSLGILLNGHFLINAALCLEKVNHYKASEKISPEALEPILQVIDALAHEMGHLHLMQLYPEKLPAATQSWGLDEQPPSHLELAHYFHNCFETHAISISIRYLRRKQQVGELIWQTLAASALAKENLETIMIAGQILGREKIKKLKTEIEPKTTSLIPKKLKQIEATIVSIVYRYLITTERMEKMKQRIDVLG